MRTKGDKPAADHRWAQIRERGRVAGTFEEADELSQVIAVPENRPRASAGYLNAT
jgi:hypothetical protein